MSVITTNTPAKAHSSGNTSKWNAVHNEISYGFRRQDYSILYGISNTTGLLRITLLTSQIGDLFVGDSLYLSNSGETVIVAQIAIGGAFAYVQVDVQATAANTVSGYANNLTQRKNYFIECQVWVYNNTTNKNEIAGTVKLATNKKGEAKLIVSSWLEKYLTRKNKSTYTQQTYNDKEAWCKFYYAYKQVWKGYENESFYEDRISPYLGANLIKNSTFPAYVGSGGEGTEWAQTNIVWTNDSLGTYMKKNIGVSPLDDAWMHPQNLVPFPTVAGKTYRLTWRVVSAKGTGYSGANSTRLYEGSGVYPSTALNFSPVNILAYCGLVGDYTFDFIPTVDGAFPAFYTDNNYWTGIDNVYMNEVFDDTILNPPRYYYANKGARQLQAPYGVNQADHVAFYFTQADVAKRAKFISDFAEPTYFVGYPFDMAILMDESMAGIETLRKEQLNNVNVATGINSHALNKIAVGEHRIKIEGGYAASVRALDVWLEVGDFTVDEYVDEEYVDDDYVEVVTASPYGTASGEVTERRRVRINQSCLDNHIYLAWKGSEGGWSYYLFKKTHTQGLEIKNQQVAYPYVSDLSVEENQFQLSGDSQPFVTLGASNIDRNDAVGISRMLESVRITMYNPTAATWQTVIVKGGTFKIYEAKDSRHDIEFTIELPFRYTHTA